MREAEPEHRPSLLTALEDNRANDPVAEKARAACVTAYRSLAEARRAASEAAAATSASPEQLLAATRRADDKITMADKQLTACRAAMVELRRHIAND